MWGGPRLVARSRDRAIRLCLVFSFLCVSAAAQQPPVFRSGTQVVEVDVRVFDKDGRFVADLRPEEIEILENGAPQTLQSLFLVDPSSDRALDRASPPSSDTSRDPAIARSRDRSAPSRQTWVFVFDLNHLVPGTGFDRAREAVEAFIRDRFREGDLAGVVAGTRMVNNKLTSVREELLAAVKSVKPLAERRRIQVEMTREWPRLLDDYEVALIAREDREAIQRATVRACGDDETRCPQADVEVRSKARRLAGEVERSTVETLKALHALASGLARVPGPKTVVFLSNGFAVENVETTLRSVVGQAARAGARIYAIDVRGLNRGGSGIIDQPAVTDEAGAFSQFDALADAPNSLAIDTGGMMIRNENNLGRALQTVAADAGQYYVLGYQPADPTFDGKYRTIDVRVKRPGVRVRARRGYLALEPSKMLIPQPIAPAPRDEPAATETPAAEPAAENPAAAPVTPGAIVKPAAGAMATGAAPTTRLRPDAEAAVKALAADESASVANAEAKQGWDAYQRGDVETALPLLQSAAAKPDARPWVWYTLGLSQFALGRARDAATSWERVRAAAPGFEAVYMDLADAYIQLSEQSNALAILREAEKRWPADPDVHNAIGVIHVSRGALDRAIEAFSHAAKSAPEDPLAYFNLGRAYELRYHRSRRFVSSIRGSTDRWVADEKDRQAAIENYEKHVKMGGPHAAQAAEAISMLQWSK